MYHIRRLRFSEWRKYVNKYSLTLLVFAIWLSFLDRHNLVTQQKLKTIISNLEFQKANFESLYENALVERKMLETDQERFAREKYYMHKENEDVFIIK